MNKKFRNYNNNLNNNNYNNNNYNNNNLNNNDLNNNNYNNNNLNNNNHNNNNYNNNNHNNNNCNNNNNSHNNNNYNNDDNELYEEIYGHSINDNNNRKINSIIGGVDTLYDSIKQFHSNIVLDDKLSMNYINERLSKILTLLESYSIDKKITIQGAAKEIGNLLVDIGHHLDSFYNIINNIDDHYVKCSDIFKNVGS